MRLSYDLVDVFTDRPFAGNQLAVVHGAEDLDTARCLALAREFNFSETTFPVPTGEGEYTTRIFTPAAEIPFAGHPTLGTAWVLRAKGLLADGTVTQVCGAGPIEVRFDEDLVSLAAAPRDLHGPLDDEETDLLLEDLGLTAGDLVGPVWVAGCGLTFVHVPVRERSLARVRVPRRPLSAYARQFAHRDPFEGINVYSTGSGGTGTPVDVRSRVFVPGLSVPEDPATGSAAAGLGLALAASGRLPDGGGFEITQGVEMGRPSLLSCRVEASGGTASLCHVAGRVQPVASGQIIVPPA